MISVRAGCAQGAAGVTQSSAPTPPTHEPTDLSELRAGHITLTPLHFDMTRRDKLVDMRQWRLRAGALPAKRTEYTESKR